MERRLPTLPREIVFNILSRLPVKPLCRFKLVSKPWLALITEPQFIKTQFERSTEGNKTQKLILASRTSPRSVFSVDYQAPHHPVAELEKPCKSGVEIVGSCNGMLLLDIVDQTFFLWNPSTRMYKKFSTPSYSDGIIIYGLGYDSASDDFKAIRAIRPISARLHNPTAVYVFTSKANSWKRIQDFAYKIYAGGPGKVLNGAPHWVVSRDTGRDFFVSSIISAIVYFDAAEEAFKEVPLPNYEGENRIIELAVLGGRLCVVHDNRESHVDVWVMKEYGVKESWTKLFVVPHMSGEFFYHYFAPLCFTKDGEVVMVLNSEKLVIYNTKEYRFRRIGIPQTCKEFDVVTYVESLVSPHGGNGTRRQQALLT